MIQRYLVIIAVVFFSSLAHAIPVADVPTPFSTPGIFVVDQAQVLGADYNALITANNQQLRDKTGVELVVVTIDNLNDLTVDDYAEQLFSRLGIGEKGKDNGVLILLSRDDRRVRIEVGYGLESVLNDAKAGRLLDESGVPYLKDNQFGRGLYYTAKAVALTVAAASQSDLQLTDPVVWPAQPDVYFGEVSPTGNTSSIFMIMGIVTGLFSIIAVGLALWYGVRCAFNRTRVGKMRALVHSDSAEAALIFMGPIAAGFIGYSEGSVWKGIAAAPIPVALWGLLRLFHRWLSHGVNHFQRCCSACGEKMAYEKAVKSHLTDVQQAEESAGGMDYEAWRCPACGKVEVVGIVLVSGSRCPKCNNRSLSYDQVISGCDVVITKLCLVAACNHSETETRSKRKGEKGGRGWSFSNQRSSGGRSGGGSSGGGGASRGF